MSELNSPEERTIFGRILRRVRPTSNPHTSSKTEHQGQDKTPRIRIVPDKLFNRQIDIASNIEASQRFLEVLRGPSKYVEVSPSQMRHELGFLVVKPIEKGYFDVASVTNTAEARYQMPLAIYAPSRHAMLVVR